MEKRVYLNSNHMYKDLLLLLQHVM